MRTSVISNSVYVQDNVYRMKIIIINDDEDGVAVDD